MTAHARIPDVAGVILAGGKSRRMGRDKRFLEVGGIRLLDRVLGILQPLFAEILIVAAAEEAGLRRDGARVVVDAIPGAGTLGGAYTGLLRAESQFAFVVACDMPLLNPMLIRWLAERPPDADVVLPKLATGVQPTHARYGRACVPVMERLLRAGNFKAQALADEPGLRVSLVEERDVRVHDPQLLSFLNLNTPADLEFAKKILTSRGADG